MRSARLAFVAVAIFMFAFSSIIGNYTYGEMNVKFLTHDRRWLIFVRVMNGIVMVIFGALASLDLVWSLGDFFMGCITLCNLFAIVHFASPCRLPAEGLYPAEAGRNQEPRVS